MAIETREDGGRPKRVTAIPAERRWQNRRVKPRREAKQDDEYEEREEQSSVPAIGA